MISNIGFFILLIGGLNLVWVLFLALMSASGTAGAKLSKKVGTDHDDTDQNIELGKSLTNGFLKQVIPRAIVTLIGLLMYFLG